MSDWSGKWRPALERIACMVGKGKGLPYLPSGAIPKFTDQDICHAVAASRRTTEGKENKRGVKTRNALAGCVRPEILELCYAGNLEHVYKVARAAYEALMRTRDAKNAGEIVRARHASLIAARAIAGHECTQVELKREAWSIACNYESLEQDVGEAKAWIEGERFEAASSFLHALKSRLDYTSDDVSAYQKGLREEARSDRESALRKEFPRVDCATLSDALGNRLEPEPDNLVAALAGLAEGRPARFGMLTLKGVRENG